VGDSRRKRSKSLQFQLQNSAYATNLNIIIFFFPSVVSPPIYSFSSVTLPDHTCAFKSQLLKFYETRRHFLLCFPSQALLSNGWFNRGLSRPSFWRQLFVCKCRILHSVRLVAYIRYPGTYPTSDVRSSCCV